MTSIDFFAIKEQIVAILKTDSGLFSATPTDKTTFRKIESGAPSPKAIDEPPIPRLWVTSDSLVANITNTAIVQSNATKGKEYDFRINIIFVVEAKDGPDTEEDIDDFTKAIIDKLEGNYDLRDDGGAESTRVAEGTDVIQIQDLPNMFKGDRVKGRVIKFRVIVRA